MVETDLDEASKNCNDWVLRPVATGSGVIHAVTKTAQLWNAKPANAVGVAPLTIRQSLQALVEVVQMLGHRRPPGPASLGS
eukprot:5393856-Pyramimonas_sp.AAC.1